MSGTAERALLWAPRLLSLFFAAFLSIFASDVFTEGRPFLLTLAALALHLIPTVLVLLLIVLAWRREWIGAIAACALGIFYISTKGRELPWLDSVIIAGPLFLIGGLYALNAVHHHRRAATA